MLLGAAGLAAVFQAVCAWPAVANTDYWLTTGSSKAVWGTGSNWSAGSAPASGDTAVFDQTGVNGTTTCTLGSSQSVGTLSFVNTSSTNFQSNTGKSTPALIVGSGGITVGGSAGQVSFSNNPGTRNLAVNLSTGQTWTNNSGTAVNDSCGMGLTVATAQTLALAGSFNFSGNISNGSGTLSLLDTGGTTTLSGSNSYSGGTMLSSGTIDINSSTAIGTGAFTVGATSGTAAVTFDNTSGSAVTNTNNNVQLWYQNFTFTGSNSLNLGTGGVTLGQNEQVTVSTNSLTIGGAISDGGHGYSITATGPGTLILASGSGSYSGGTYINGGNLWIATDGSLGAVPTLPTVNVTINGGVLVNDNSSPTLSANRTIYLGSGGGYFEAGWGQALTINGQITGTGSFNMNFDSGTVVLANNTASPNNWTGNTTIGSTFNNWQPNSPTLQMGGPNQIPYGTSAGNVTFGTDGSYNTPVTLDLNGYNTQVNGLTGGATAVINNSSSNPAILTVGNNNQNSSFGGVIENTGSGALSIAQTGGGTCTISGTANTYSGSTSIINGTLQLGATNALPVGTTVNFGGSGTSGVFDLAGYSQQVAGLGLGSGASWLSSDIVGSSGSSPVILTIAGSCTFGGVIQDVLGSGSGSVSLNIQSGTVILTGSNTYSGSTTINSGATLQIGTPNAIQNSPLNPNGGSLTFSTGITSMTCGGLIGGNNLTLPSGVTNLTLNPGVTAALTYTGVLSGPAGMTLTINGPGSQAFTQASNYSGDTIVYAGSLSGLTGSFGTGNLTVNPTGTTAATVTSNASIAATAIVTVNSTTQAQGTLNLVDPTPTIAQLNGTGSVVLGASSFGGGGTNLTITNGGNFSGSIGDGAPFGGAGSLTLSGGTLVLSGTGSYTGTTTVNGGSLRVNGASATGSSVVTVNGGTLGGNGTISTQTTINGGATVAAGADASTVGTLTDTGGMIWNSGAQYSWKISSLTGTAGSNWDEIQLGTGILMLGGSGNTYTINIVRLGSAINADASGETYVIVDAASITGFSGSSFIIDDPAGSNSSGNTWIAEVIPGGNGEELVIVAAPEPGSLGLLGIAALGLLKRRTKKIKR